MQDEAGYEAGCRLDPMLVLSAFFTGSAKHFCNVLSVGYFAERADAHFGKRVETGAMFFDRSEAKADVTCGASITSGPVPVFTLDVEDDCALFPCQQRWNDKAYTLAGSSRGEGEDMFRACVSEVFERIGFLILPGANVDAVLLIDES